MVTTPPVNLTGLGMRVRRKNGSQAVPYDMLAAAKTKSLTYTNEFGETTTHDADHIDAVPWRTSLLQSRSWTMTISGASDQGRFALLQGDATAATSPTRYQLEFAGSAAAGGGAIEGALWVENLQIQSQNLGIVEFSCQLRGEGAPSWTPVSA